VRLKPKAPCAAGVPGYDAGGVQRTGVTAAAGALQRAGLIRYKRGNVTIVDRRGLIRRSCECYGVSKKEFDRLLGDRAKPKVRSN
jgi:hypothetical protein